MVWVSSGDLGSLFGGWGRGGVFVWQSVPSPLGHCQYSAVPS